MQAKQRAKISKALCLRVWLMPKFCMAIAIATFSVGCKKCSDEKFRINFFAKCFAQNLLSWQSQLRVRGVSAIPIRKTQAFHVVIRLFCHFCPFRLLKTPHICSINGIFRCSTQFVFVCSSLNFRFRFSAFVGFFSRVWAVVWQASVARWGNNIFFFNNCLLFWHYIVKCFGTQAQTLRLYKCTQFYNVLDRGIK